MIVDAEGCPTGDSDDSWMLYAVIQWLGDERCLTAILGRRILGAPKVAAVVLQNTLARAIEAARTGAPLDFKKLRRFMLLLLQDRVIRISIARVVLVNERMIRDEYEATMDALPKVIEAWQRAVDERGEALAGPRPEVPEEPPEPRHRKEVLAELQHTREELETRVASEALIVRPFGG